MTSDPTPRGLAPVTAAADRLESRHSRRTVLRATAALGLAGGALAAAGPATAAPADVAAADVGLGPDVITPQQFGAVGDGEADDTDALQQAIDANRQRPNKLVFLPYGTYRITRPLVVADLEQIEVPAGELPTNLNRMILLGCGARGSRTSTILVEHDGTAIEWRAALSSVHGVAFLGTDRGERIGLLSARETSSDDPNRLVNSDDTDLVVTDCSFTNFDAAVRHIGRGLVFTNNTTALCNSSLVVSWPAEGIGRNPTGQGPHVLPYGLRKWLITDNHFHSAQDTIIFDGPADGDFRGAVISNNLLDIGRRLFRGSLTNSTISGNVVENGTGGADGLAIIEITAGGSNLTIADNVLGGFDLPPGGVYDDFWGGIWRMPPASIEFTVPARDVVCSANSFNWTDGPAIHCAAGAEGVSITANSFDQFNHGAQPDGAAVLVTGDAVRLSLTANTFGEGSGARVRPLRVTGTLAGSQALANVYDAETLVAAAEIDADTVVQTQPGHLNQIQVGAALDGVGRIRSTSVGGVESGDRFGSWVVDSAVANGAGPGTKGGLQVVATNRSGSAATNLLCATTSSNGVVSVQASSSGLVPPADNARDLGSAERRYRTVYTHSTTLQAWNRDAMPAAEEMPGALVFVSDGDSGRPGLALSDGSAWRLIALRGTVR